MEKQPSANPFTPYQKLVVFMLVMAQFSVYLDFTVMSPLGDMLMKAISLKPEKFSVVVSAYAFSACVSGLLTAGFADRFDRKKTLLVLYAGFILGTIFCSAANTYPLLVAARIITGLFGGVIGSVSMAVVTDLFPMQQRGRAMGFMQIGLGASQVLGIPVSLFLANALGWQSPFVLVAALSAIIALVIIIKMRPVTGHLALQYNNNPAIHLWATLSKPGYRMGFLGTALLLFGGFMIIPFISSFAINNIKITTAQLPVVYMASGITSLAIMPFIGRLSDKADKFTVFVFASVWMMVMFVVYTNLSVTPFWLVLVCNALMMMGVMGRLVPSTALLSSLPGPQDRGAYMGINSSLQQLAGGMAALIAGLIVKQKDKSSPIEHYNILGYISVIVSLVCIYAVYKVNVTAKTDMRKTIPAALLAEEYDRPTTR